MSTAARVARFALAVMALSLTLVTAAFAQRHAGAIGSAGSIRAVPARSSGFRPVQRVGTPLHPNFAPTSRVPGLSFNIQGLAAADRRNRFWRGQVVTPFLSYYPFYSPYLDYGYSDEPYNQPTDQPYDQPPYYDQPPLPPAPPPTPLPPGESSPSGADLQSPAPEVGQYVLVRLDGQVLFAVAFTVTNHRLTYVSREGLRRSFPVSELDKEATREMNDANGSTVSLPD